MADDIPTSSAELLYVDLTAPYKRLEHFGRELASQMGARLRGSLSGDLADTVNADIARRASPYGPDFDYATAPHLFGPRRGVGPLYVAWDTNVLINYFKHGWSIWRQAGLPDDLEEGTYSAMEGLELVLALSVVRDIRHVILPEVIDDARKKLSADRRRERTVAFDQFSQALRLVSETTDLGDLTAPSSDGLLTIPQRTVEELLTEVPAGLDRRLVRAALRSGSHVFMTTDKGVLRCASALRPTGLAIGDPQDVFEWLFSARAFHCLLDPSMLWWPLPDQQRMSHLVAALPGS